MFKFALSVRSYNYGRRYGCLPYYEDLWAMSEAEARKACLQAAEALLARGCKRQAVELFRAAGLGYYNILGLMTAEGVNPWTTLTLCEGYDKSLHGR